MINLVMGVSLPPVLDCRLILHPGLLLRIL